MLSPSELEQFAKVCNQIANDVADESGFVPVRGLLERFRATLVARPLLVEGMLASIDTDVASQSPHPWAVLVDSEMYRVSETAIEEERVGHPLAARLRNTVAHELVHSLAFRPSDFGVRLNFDISAEKNKAALVEAIEQQTERFSPLLLWSRKALENLVITHGRALSVDNFTETRRVLGMSREVIISRLNLLPPADELRNLSGLANVAIGIAEWAKGGTALLRKWPLFINFHGNVVPSFLNRLRNQDYLPSTDVFKDTRFAMSGGTSRIVDFEAAANHPNPLPATCMVERSDRKAGSRFLFMVRRVDKAIG